MDEECEDSNQVVIKVEADTIPIENEFLGYICCCVENAKRDIERVRESRCIGEAANKLIAEVISCLGRAQKDKRLLVDHMTRDGAAELFEVYFDIFAGKLEKSLDLSNLNRLLYICTHFTDQSAAFSEDLVGSGTIRKLTDILKMYRDTFKYTETQGHMVMHAMLILYNCSISSKNKRYYNTGLLRLVGWYTRNSKGVKIHGQGDLYTCCLLTLAHVRDEDDNDVKVTDDEIIDNIMENLDMATRGNDKSSGVTFSAKELVVALTNLANNDEASVTIVQKGAFPKLMLLIEKGTVDEKIAATTCVWALSFVDDNKILINRNSKVKEKLTALLKHDEKELRQKAAGALWESRRELSRVESDAVWDRTDDDQTKADKPTTTVPTISTCKASSVWLVTLALTEALQVSNKLEGRHVMLSYNWENQRIIEKVKERLESSGYNVWMDIHHMKGDTLDAMAHAVEQSSVVLICMSQKYKDSQNCRSEAEYAYKKKKTIIPLKLQKGYYPNGWLGIIAGTNLYFNFAEEKKFNASLSKLIDEIGNMGKKPDSFDVVDGPINQPVQSKLLQPPRESNPQPVNSGINQPFEVQQWVEKHGLQLSRFVNIDLETLEFLRSLKSEAPEYFYRHINQQLGIVTSKELMLFTKALHNLH